MLTEKILQIGNPKLRMISEPIDESWFGTSKLHDLGQSLLRMMVDNIGIGLAAPQVGLLKRLFVIGMDKNLKRPNEKPIKRQVLINPVWIPITDEKASDYESCLSIGTTLMGQVPRYKKIAIRSFDIEGNLFETEVQGLHARVIQHEYDHLDGILFLDRVEDTKTIGYYEELFAKA